MSRDYYFGKPAHVRVELKRKFNDSWKNFKEMLHEFTRRVIGAGIIVEIKEHRHYESPGEKSRKLKRDSKKKIVMESLTKKIVAGEKVDNNNGMVKKIMATIRKEKEKEKKRERNKYEDSSFNKYSVDE